MTTHAIAARPLFTLRNVLLLDATTCALMGLALLCAASPLSQLLELSAGLLQYAGLALLPIAAFFAWVATRRPVHRPGTWMAIAGNGAWVVASIAVLAMPWLSPNVQGELFVLAQAAVVAVLAALEVVALRRE